MTLKSKEYECKKAGNMKGELNIKITQEGDTFKATITNGSINPVHIEGCESEEIAQQQADDRVNELKQAGIIK